jgi:hypothetical protein
MQLACSSISMLFLLQPPTLTPSLSHTHIHTHTYTHTHTPPLPAPGAEKGVPAERCCELCEYPPAGTAEPPAGFAGGICGILISSFSTSCSVCLLAWKGGCPGPSFLPGTYGGRDTSKLSGISRYELSAATFCAPRLRCQYLYFCTSKASGDLEI